MLSCTTSLLFQYMHCAVSQIWLQVFLCDYLICLNPDTPDCKLKERWDIICFFSHQMLQFSSVQSCLTLCDPMNLSTPGLLVHHQLPEPTQTRFHRVSDAIQPSHPLSCPSPPAPNPSQHKVLFQWVNSSHEVAKVLEFQLQHQSFQWTPRTDLL